VFAVAGKVLDLGAFFIDALRNCATHVHLFFGWLGLGFRGLAFFLFVRYSGHGRLPCGTAIFADSQIEVNGVSARCKIVRGIRHIA